MLVLAMAAALCDESPTVVLDQPDDLAELQTRIVLRGRPFVCDGS